MQIKFNGQYDKKLFFNAVRIANEPGRSARMLHILVAMVFGVMTVTTAQDILSTGDWAGNFINLALIALMGLVLYQAYVPAYLGARKMWNGSNVQRPLNGYVTEKGITYKFEQGNKFYPWSDFNRRRQIPNLITLVTLRGMLLIFPRHFFKSDADWEKFNSLAETRIIVTKKK